MRITKSIYGLLLAGCVLSTQSCEKIEDFGDTNINPGLTTEPVTSALLTQTIATIGSGVIVTGTTSTPVTGGLIWDQGGIATVAGLYAQYFSETQYTDESRYADPNFDIDNFYSGPLYDLQNIINYNSNEATAAKAAVYGSNENQIGIARILRAHYFKFLSDAFGDIPYSQALTGSGLPVFDPQEAIYKDLLKELTEAVDQLNPSAAISVKGDILYNGSINSWQRYGNSLRALIALQMSKKDPTTGSAAFKAAIAHPAGVIETNAQSAVIKYPGGNFRNPFYNYYNVTARFDYAISEPIVSRLSANNDNRLNAFTDSPKGFPYGFTRENAVNWANGNSDYGYVLSQDWKMENSPLTLLGAANVWLARAEAAQRGWTAENAATAYQTGIMRSWEQWGVYDATKFSTFMTQPNVTLAAGNELTQIATQQYLAWFPNGMEGWNTWRRTGAPALTPAVGTTAIPRRFAYGPNEYNLNPTNVKEAAGRYNDDSQYGRIWWDQ